jgi:hypothetical protein
MPRRTFLLPTLLLLSAGGFIGACGFTGGDYPSLKPRPAETPRSITAPGAGLAPELSAEERSALAADVARESDALEAATSAMATAARELDPALAAARGAAPGSEAWSAAQMALSRYDLARSPLGDIDARLSPLLRKIDSLPADHPDRQAVESLAAAVDRAGADAERAVQAAGATLGAPRG